MDKIVTEIQQGLRDGDAQFVKEKTEQALIQGVQPKNIIQQGLLPVMKSIGKKFRVGEIFIPDVLMSSRAMHASLYVLNPILSKHNKASKGLIVIGTVAGDLHDIGKNMVSMVLRGAGYRVVDLGIDVPTIDFIAAVQRYQPDILGMSALLTTTIGEMDKVIMELKEKGLKNKVKVLIGGGPVTPEFAIAIEADGYAYDAFSTIDVVDGLIVENGNFFTAT